MPAARIRAIRAASCSHSLPYMIRVIRAIRGKNKKGRPPIAVRPPIYERVWGLFVGVRCHPVISVPATGELVTVSDGLIGVNGNAVKENGGFNVHSSNVHCGNDILFHNWQISKLVN